MAFVGWQLLARPTATRLAGVGLALVLGGAVGNILDRLLRGEVVDFLDFYLRIARARAPLAAFNVADSAISVGAACVILAEIARPREEQACTPS